MIAIAVRGPNLAERCVTLEAGTLQIGRSSRCEIALPGDGVTRLHARITVAHGRALLVDAGSTNGTFVNGVRTCSACGQRVSYRATLDEARGHALRGEPGTIDARAGRTGDDLSPAPCEPDL